MLIYTLKRLYDTMHSNSKVTMLPSDHRHEAVLGRLQSTGVEAAP